VKGLQTLIIQTLRLKGRYIYFNVTAAGHPFYLNSVQGTGTANAYNSGVTNNGAVSGSITYCSYECTKHAVLQLSISWFSCLERLQINVSIEYLIIKREMIKHFPFFNLWKQETSSVSNFKAVFDSKLLFTRRERYRGISIFINYNINLFLSCCSVWCCFLRADSSPMFMPFDIPIIKAVINSISFFFIQE
jgi:hypothetical protein